MRPEVNKKQFHDTVVSHLEGEGNQLLSAGGKEEKGKGISTCINTQGRFVCKRISESSLSTKKRGGGGQSK